MTIIYRYGIIVIVPLRNTESPKWRNWQTHLTQNQAGLRSCRFESGLRHQRIYGFRDFSEAFYFCQNSCENCYFPAVFLWIFLVYIVTLNTAEILIQQYFVFWSSGIMLKVCTTLYLQKRLCWGRSARLIIFDLKILNF